MDIATAEVPPQLDIGDKKEVGDGRAGDLGEAEMGPFFFRMRCGAAAICC
jgi:hypothetical protein